MEAARKFASEMKPAPSFVIRWLLAARSRQMGSCTSISEEGMARGASRAQPG